MNRLLRLTIVFALLIAPLAVFAQGGGIKGVLKDTKGNPVVNAVVEVSSGGIVKLQTTTDFDGEYSARPLDGGRYDVKFSFQGHVELVNDVILSDNQVAPVNARIETGAVLKGIVVRGHTYVKPLIDRNNPGDHQTKTGVQIDKMPGHNTNDLAGLTTQVHQGSSGAGLSIAGGRTSGTKYVIDGVQQTSGEGTFTNQNPGNVEAVSTFTSGIPARYGDASGGLVTITTRGATSTTQGNVQYEHSFEGYNQNELTFNLSGPLLRKKDSTGKKGRPIVGYSLTADGIYADDYSPSYDKSYAIRPDRLYQLEQHPLVQVQNAGVTELQYATSYIQQSDLELRKTKPNSKYLRGNVGGKLDFNLTDNISVRLGANYYNANTPDYSRGLSLYSADQFQRNNSQTGRGYLRFTQRFGNRVDKSEIKDGAITNASYTAQIDYQKDYVTNQDPTHKQNTFDYGYVGKFEEHYMPIYQAGGIDALTGKAGVQLLGYQPTGVTFTPGTQNQLLANYTKDYYAYNANPFQQIQISGSNFGQLNGDAPRSAYNLFPNVGVSSNSWNKSNNDQVGVAVDASFDIKQGRATHSIEFGLFYQQKTYRSYSIGTLSTANIWGLMRQLTSRVVGPSELDTRTPRFIINGGRDTISYADVLSGKYSPGPNDTIIYDRKFDSSAQGAFDRHLREKLYAMGEIKSMRDYINTDKYDPSLYSVDMFSADELLNSGTSLVSYYGYDYTGKQVNGQVNFNDFWTKKNAEGDYTRPIGAYRPNYIAGYISDAIQYKDFNITLGVRIERFDNNTKVLKDPYTFTPAKTASEISAYDLRDAVTGEKYTIPSNIGGSYVAYTGSNSATTPTVIGYRDGDTWYDRTGKEVEDPRVLQTETSSNTLQPWLEHAKTTIRDSTFDPNGSFTDYKPQINAMPRINFSFPLNEDALFYAHYDIMFQRPGSANAFATPVNYYFVDQLPNNIYGNSNLKPERTIDYEVGFQQRLTENSAITLSGFYKERKDQIQVRQFLFAYPSAYYAYGNRDFSTYKGLSLAYELRRPENSPLSMTINYTLSFTEGTGSGTTSSSQLIGQLFAAGVPNLRPQFPVDYDSRHNLNAQIDYRYRYAEGPTIRGNHFLENFGAQLVFRARSGEPYTKYANAQDLQVGAANSSQLVGSVNASRLPWHYNFDLNIDKTFPLKWVKSPDGKQRTPGRLNLNIYAYSRNLFNIRDILGVYGFTGRADDDGYLTSALGQTVTTAQVSPSSFAAQYQAYSTNPNLYGNPRLIFVGARLNF